MDGVRRHMRVGVLTRQYTSSKGKWLIVVGMVRALLGQISVHFFLAGIP